MGSRRALRLAQLGGRARGMADAREMVGVSAIGAGRARTAPSASRISMALLPVMNPARQLGLAPVMVAAWRQEAVRAWRCGLGIAVRRALRVSTVHIHARQGAHREGHALAMDGALEMVGVSVTRAGRARTAPSASKISTGPLLAMKAARQL